MTLADSGRVLSFTSLGRRDNGKYLCEVSNPISSSRAEYTLDVSCTEQRNYSSFQNNQSLLFKPWTVYFSVLQMVQRTLSSQVQLRSRVGSAWR